jgi:hypothetical protein
MYQPIDSILAQPLLIRPHFSVFFSSFLLGLHLGALIILLSIAYVHWLMFGLGLLVLWSAWRTYRRDLCFIQHPLYDSRLVITQEYDNLPTEYLLLNNGQRAKLLAGSYAHPLIVILNVKILDTNKSASLIIWNDMLDKETFRRLRVRVKHRFSK